MILAVFYDIFEEIFLVGELIVMFEVVQGMFEYAVIYAVFIFIIFIALLPA